MLRLAELVQNFDSINTVVDSKKITKSAYSLPVVDYAPLKTYEKLLALHEACIVGYHWAEFSYPPPNRHLIEDYLSSEYVNGYRSASPFEMIGDVFYEKNYIDIRQNILELYTTCSCKRKGIDLKASDLRSTLRWLLETGWLLLQTDYFPEDWLDPNSIDFLRCPIPEKQAEYWKPKSLSGKEQKKLKKHYPNCITA